MDRNVFLTLTVRNVPIVALRKESVDRNLNMSSKILILPGRVALRKESVDRNVDPDSDTFTDAAVALRTESGDRNFG